MIDEQILTVDEVAKIFGVPDLAHLLQNMDRPKFNEIEAKVEDFTKSLLQPLAAEKAREIARLKAKKRKLLNHEIQTTKQGRRSFCVP